MRRKVLPFDRRTTVRPMPTPRVRERRALAVTVIVGVVGVFGSVFVAVFAASGLGL